MASDAEKEERRRRQIAAGIVPVDEPPSEQPILEQPSSIAGATRREAQIEVGITPIERPSVPVSQEPSDSILGRIGGAVTSGLGRARDVATIIPPIPFFPGGRDIPVVDPALRRGVSEAIRPLDATSESIIDLVTDRRIDQLRPTLNPLGNIQELSEEFRQRPLLEQIALGIITDPATIIGAPALATRLPGLVGRLAARRVVPAAAARGIESIPRQGPVPPPRQQLALGPGTGRTVSGAIEAPGRVSPGFAEAERVLGPIESRGVPTATDITQVREPSLRTIRGDIPFEASTPAEAAQFRQRVRELPAGQRTHIPPPEEIVTPQQAKEVISKEFYDAIPDSPTDIAATAYYRTGKITEFLKRVPKVFEVAKGFAEETFQEVGRASAFLSDPTRMVESIDLNGFGRAMQRGLLWPTRRTMLASVNWGDVTKIDYRKMLDRHGIRGSNPIRTRQKLDAAGDVLEEIGTNELNISRENLIPSVDHLLKEFSDIEKAQIISVAVDTRILMDNLLRIQNVARVRRGQSAIGRIQNYLPHMRQSNVWSRVGMSNLPAKEIADAIPPPDFIKPNAPFNPRAMTRRGGLEGYERIRNIERLVNDYIETARKDIFYTNIIQNGKAHIRALKQRGGLDNAAEAIEEWIMEAFAGKSPLISRAASKGGRVTDAALALRRSLTRSVFPLNWTWNAFVQTSSMGLTIKRFGVTSTIQGLDFLSSVAARKAVRENAYSSIIKRRGAGKAALQDVGPGIGDTSAVQRSALDTVEGAANFFTNIIEDNLTGISVRAAYHDGVRRGLKGRALWEYASEGGSKTQSMYNLEDLPGMLRAKEVGAVFPFQTFAFEVMNTVRESGIPGLGRIGSRVERNRMVSLFQFFGAIVATNMVIDKVSGRSPWQLSSFVPFWGVLGAGLDSGNTWNYPLPIKYMADLKKGMEDVAKHGNFNRLRAWAIRYHVPAGTQIERMIRGIETVALNEGEVSNVAGKELFTIDTNSAKEVAQAIVGGVYTTSPGKEYVDQLQDSKGPIFRFTGIPTKGFIPAR